MYAEVKIKGREDSRGEYIAGVADRGRMKREGEMR